MGAPIGATWKLEMTRRLNALGQRFLIDVDLEAIDIDELTQFVTTWQSAADEPAAMTAERVDELALMIAVMTITSGTPLRCQ